MPVNPAAAQALSNPTRNQSNGIGPPSEVRKDPVSRIASRKFIASREVNDERGNGAIRTWWVFVVPSTWPGPLT